MASHSATGYVNDVPYTLHFARELVPDWLDFVVTLSGLTPPVHGGRFRWCELGCGLGMTAAVVAATHPASECHGIDAYAPHIECARRLCDDAGIDNLTLHALDFAAANELGLGQFDYIVAHGVYTWIDSRARDDFRQFIARHLKPGGTVFVSYNAMPGWANDTPFQFLVRELGERRDGNSIEQFVGAMQTIEDLAAAGAVALTNGYMGSDGWAALRRSLPINYFAHEFLAPAWQPLYVTQLRTDMRSIGLTPAGSGSIRHNFDSFVLSASARQALQAIDSPDLRELARDYFLNRRFRADVFTTAGDDDAMRPQSLTTAERTQRLLETTFALQRPAALVQYTTETEAGTLTFDSASARAIVAGLADGPRRLADVTSEGTPAQLIAAAMALAAANEIRPVRSRSATPTNVTRLNDVLLHHMNGDETPRFVGLPYGTAMTVPLELLAAMRDGNRCPEELRSWAELLASNGVRV